MPLKSLTAAALLFGLAGCATAPAPMTLETLLNRHTASRGGAGAIEAVSSIRIGLEITEPGFTVHGDYVATRDGSMRIDIYADDKRVFTEALRPDGAWQLRQEETVGTPSSPEGMQALERGRVGNLYGLHERSALGYRLTLDGAVQHEGVEQWQITETAPDGFVKRYFLDAETFLVARNTETSALHPDIDDAQTRQETRFSDYRPSEDVLFARRSEKFDFDKDEIVQTVIVKTVEINPEIDPKIFERPK